MNIFAAETTRRATMGVWGARMGWAPLLQTEPALGLARGNVSPQRSQKRLATWQLASRDAASGAQIAPQDRASLSYSIVRNSALRGHAAQHGARGKG
jgi:hypothetical protein